MWDRKPLEKVIEAQPLWLLRTLHNLIRARNADISGFSESSAVFNFDSRAFSSVVILSKHDFSEMPSHKDKPNVAETKSSSTFQVGYEPGSGLKQRRHIALTNHQSRMLEEASRGQCGIFLANTEHTQTAWGYPEALSTCGGTGS
jgi:hypothetical protein